MTLTRDHYHKRVIPVLRGEFGYASIMAVPRVAKVVVNVGVGRIRDEKQLAQVAKAVGLITGQKAAPRTAKKAIAAFKTRRGLVVGYQVTLRGKRMWDFLSRLVDIAIPRQRDFHGLDPASVDRNGNLTIGFREHIVFPEMIGEDVPFIFGFEVTVVTTARARAEGISLLRALGFPIHS